MTEIYTNLPPKEDNALDETVKKLTTTNAGSFVACKVAILLANRSSVAVITSTVSD